MGIIVQNIHDSRTLNHYFNHQPSCLTNCSMLSFIKISSLSFLETKTTFRVRVARAWGHAIPTRSLSKFKRLKRTAIMHPEHFYLLYMVFRGLDYRLGSNGTNNDPIFHAAEKSPKKYFTTSNAGTKSITQKKIKFLRLNSRQTVFSSLPGTPETTP